jgi:hypothetical protein
MGLVCLLVLTDRGSERSGTAKANANPAPTKYCMLLVKKSERLEKENRSPRCCCRSVQEGNEKALCRTLLLDSSLMGLLVADLRSV